VAVPPVSAVETDEEEEILAEVDEGRDAGEDEELDEAA
jgi:hypothetical protein